MQRVPKPKHGKVWIKAICTVNNFFIRVIRVIRGEK